VYCTQFVLLKEKSSLFIVKKLCWIKTDDCKNGANVHKQVKLVPMRYNSFIGYLTLLMYLSSHEVNISRL
jgi:hypothetical protein